MTPEVDPRTERTRSVVLAATADLLAEEGFERLTIDHVAERSGVARSTIYRNWPDRQSLLVEAFETLCVFADPPDSGSLAEDLRIVATAMANDLTSERWGRAIPSLVGAVACDPELQAAQQEFNRRRRAVTTSIFEHAVERGEIPAGRDLDTVVTRFVAPFFFAKLVTYEPLDADYVDRMVQATIEEVTR